MYRNFVYYVLDTVSETIIGTFNAKSDLMATRIMAKFDFKKANLSPDDVEVYRNPDPMDIFETYGEVIKTIGVSSNILDFCQDKLDFDKEAKDGE